MTLAINETNYSGVDKALVYKWQIADSPGQMQMIDKKNLSIDDTYQRSVSDADLKVKRMAANWSWIACGVLVVAERAGKLFVVDGQHRARAAMKLSNITAMPCIVFQSAGATDEASAFLRANKDRKPMQAIQAFKAMVAANEPDAVFLADLIHRHGMIVAPGQNGNRNFGAVGMMLQVIKRGRDAAERVLDAAIAASDKSAPHSEIIKGLDYIDAHFDDDGILPSIRDRLAGLGKQRILNGISQAKAFRGVGGAKVCAEGILSAYNHRLRKRIEL